jgi:hypothetical protein
MLHSTTRRALPGTPSSSDLFENGPDGSFVIKGAPQIHVSISGEPAPGTVLLVRWSIPEGRTVHPRLPRLYDRLTPTQREAYAQRIKSDPSLVELARERQSIFAGQDGWVLRATSDAVEAREGGMVGGRSSAKRLLVAWKQVAASGKVWLWPDLPKSDPYRAPKLVHTPWVRDDCILQLMRFGAVNGLRFAVMPIQRYVDRESGWVGDQVPARELKNAVIRAASGDTTCEVVPQREGMSLAHAASVLGFDNLRQPLSASADRLYEAFVAARRGGSADAHSAYHRVLMHRFLNRTSLTGGRAPGGVEIERRANLLQAHRLFVFDTSGCPISVNGALVRDYGLMIARILDKHVTQPRMMSAKDTWGQWLFTKVLGREPRSCAASEEQVDGIPIMRGLLEGTLAIR